MDLRKEVLYYDSFVDFPTNGQENKLYLDKANGALYYWDGSAYALAGDGSGGVTGVTASAPLASSGGAIPDITISQADSSTDGYLSYTDWNTFNGKLTTVSTDGSSITGDGTPGNPLEATGSSSSPTVQVVLFADLATTERLNPCTYSNGTLGVGATLTGSSNGQLSTISFSGKIDNVSTALNQTIIVSQQYDKRQNGLYVVTQLGDASNPFILTRSADSDTQAEMYPLQINTYGGATLSNRAFLQKTVDPVIGTDNIVFTTSTIGIQTSNLNFVDTVTSAALPSCTYTSGTNPTVPGSGARLTATANGSIGTINGITLALNNRILVKDQANQAHNGDYSVTQVGSASTPFILTRVSAWGGEFPRLVREWKVNNPSSSKYGARYSTNLSSLSNTNVGVTAISFYEVIVKDSDLSLSDITTNDVSTAKHGFAPKAPNDTTKFLRGDGTWAVPAAGSSSGVFGIADSSGTYTYYTTLTLAMAAATSGQTIEMFADVTESSVTSITLKNGVNINGNGHTYNYTAATGNCFIDNGVAVVCSILNLIVNRTLHTSGNIFTLTATNTDINFSGTSLKCTSASSNAFVIVCGGTISNVTVLATGASLQGINVYAFGAKGIVKSSSAETTGAGTAIAGDILYNVQHGIFNCIGKSVSGIGISGARIVNCSGYSTSNYGLDGISNYQSVGFSISSYGIRGGTSYGCTGISSSGIGIGGNVYNCTGISSTGNAYFPDNALTIAQNSTFYTAGASVTNWFHTGNYYNCSLESAWNNSAGHCIVDQDTMVSSTQIVNCTFKVANALAYAIYATNASSFKYANNVYIGSTTPLTANITQAIVNTQDNQGNILL